MAASSSSGSALAVLQTTTTTVHADRNNRSVASDESESPTHRPIKPKRNHQAFRASVCCLTRTRVNNGPCISSESQALVATLLDSSCPGHIHGQESASPTPPSTWQHSPRFHGARTSCSLRRRLGRIRWGSVAKRGNFPRKVQMP